MRYMFIILLIYGLIFCYNVKSQTIKNVDNWIEFIGELATETENPELLESLYEDLFYLSQHPVNLNEVSQQELKKIPFLSEIHINSIVVYLLKYGKMVLIYELKNIPELDNQVIQFIIPFVYIGDNTVDKPSFSVKNLLKYASNELVMRYDNCFQYKKGYLYQPDSILEKYPNRQYVGEPFYHSFRYSYTCKDKIQAGLVMEKDAGEPFWQPSHKGYDFYSFHLLLKDINKLKSFVIGDYKISFGQGLIISNDYFPGRNSIVVNAERRTNGFRRHYSTNEYDFFRGIASTFTLANTDISFFYSSRKMDGNIEDNQIKSIQTSGTHRLTREMERKNNFTMTTLGGNLRYAIPDFHVGITAITYSFGSFELYPDEKPYNTFYFRGNRNSNMSIDYMFKNRKMKMFGETAFSQNKKLASLNAFQLTPVSYLSFLAIYRYYDRAYHSFFGNAFSQNSGIQNEQGIYLGMSIVPFAYWKISGYVDIFRFPWLKYGIDSPSRGKEYMTQLNYSQLKTIDFYIRYRYKQKEKNYSSSGQSLSVYPYKQHKLRLQNNCYVKDFHFKWAVEGILSDHYQEKMKKGYMFSQSIGWKKQDYPFQMDVYTAYFNTDNYDTRIYSYEKNMLYTFYTPSLYGKGYRITGIFKWELIKNISLSIKLAMTHYKDRDVIGTGLEEIQGNRKSDLYTVLKYKF